MIARLRQQSSRLLTITGAGGVGKTRLALQAAQALIPAPGIDTPFAHGVYFAPLATLGEHETPGDVLAATLVSALGIALAGLRSTGGSCGIAGRVGAAASTGDPVLA